jgi:acyl-coenzyme A thioesterase PaaI-like protein
MNSAQLAEALRAAVPFNTTLGVEYVSLSATEAVLRLPDRPDLHNHVGGPHAGALFSLGEAASGGVVIAAFGEHLASVTPLAANADIRYRRLAKGGVTATATLAESPAELMDRLAADGKVAFDVPITITDDSGETTTEMTVRWHLRRNNPS